MDLTTAQAAERLQVTPETVAVWCKRGDLPGAYRLSRSWRIPPDALDALKTPAVTLAPRSRRSAAQQKRTAA